MAVFLTREENRIGFLSMECYQTCPKEIDKRKALDQLGLAILIAGSLFFRGKSKRRLIGSIGLDENSLRR